MIDFEHIRSLIEKASPLPWDHNDAHEWSPDAEYIVAACNTVPALLDEIERLKGIIRKIEWISIGLPCGASMWRGCTSCGAPERNGHHDYCILDNWETQK